MRVDRDITLELIKVIPTLLWVGLVIALVFTFRKPILEHLLPRMTGLSAFGVEATFVKEELDRAADTSSAGSEQNRSQVARRAERISSVLDGARIILVNDVPQEMHHVIRILESLKIRVDVATSTDEALNAMSKTPYDAVISDIRRDDIQDEGIRFLNETLQRGLYRPTVLTAGRYDAERGTPPHAFGITNRVDELLNLIFDILERERG